MSFLIWLLAISLSFKAVYESVKSFLQEFIKSDLSSTDVWIYAGLFMVSVALVFVNFEQIIYEVIS